MHLESVLELLGLGLIALAQANRLINNGLSLTQVADAIQPSSYGL